MRHVLAERGFATIATGKDRYYELALNLLRSYRFHTNKPYPFAILCDRTNEKTSEFDDIILIEDATHSYNDKLLLFDYLPYQETIFVDADSLAYGDLNEWFDMFKDQGPFSCFGYAYKDLSTKKGWFSLPGMGEYTNEISFIPSFNGGVYYLRNTEICKKVFQIAKQCVKDYHCYSFSGFKEPADEPVLALGMAVCGCEPLDKAEIAFAPRPKSIQLDIVSGIAKSIEKNCSFRLIHWSNYLTLKSDYQFEARKLKATYDNKCRSLLYRLLYERHLAYSFLWIYDLYALFFRIIRKIRKSIP